MNANRSLLILRGIAILVIFTAGCTSTLPALPTTEISTPSMDVIPTSTQPLLPTTLPPPQTATPTPTLTSTPTSTILPTLNPTQIVLKVEELLRTNGDCTPPCLWGLAVGKATYEEVLRFFEVLGDKGYTETNDKGEIVLYNNSYRARNDNIPIEIVFDFKSGIIQNIRMFVGGLYDPEVSREDWSAYSLKSMLQLYGVPTKVGFSVQFPTEPPFNSGLIAYAYVVHFEHQNVTYFYAGGQIDEGQYFEVCPMSPYEYADALWLFLGKHPYGDFQQLVDLSEATPLDLEGFYNLFVDGDETTCLNLDTQAFQEK